MMYGLSFAYWQNQWPNLALRDYGKDRRSALFYGIVWLAALPIFIIFDKKGIFSYGIKFK